jgi:signal transduction histidine kinase
MFGHMTLSDSAPQGDSLLGQSATGFTPRVLLVEDSPIDVRLVQLMLRKAEASIAQVELTVAGTLAEAINCIGYQAFDVTLLDLSLPDSSGLSTLSAIQDAQPTVPIVVLTATGDEQAGVAALRLGAQDYLIKGEISPALLVRSIRYAIERKQSELRLADSQAFLTDILNLSPDVIAVLQATRDPYNRIINFQWRLINPAAERSIGHAASLLSEQYLLSTGSEPGAQAALPFTGVSATSLESVAVLAEQASRELFAWLLPVVAQDLTRSREVFDRRFNSWFRVDACKLGDGVRLMCRNITQYKAIERMKDEFVSIVSHELRTPFGSLQGAIKLLATGRCDLQSAQGQQLIAMALRSAERLGQAIHVVLKLADLASTESLVQQHCRVRELVEQTIKRFDPRAQLQGITITLDIPNDLVLLVDPEAMSEVFDRLLENAIQFSQPDSFITISSEFYSDEIVFQIQDQGCGIPSTDLEKVFEPFYQVNSSDSRDRSGLGVGLTLCRRIVEQHQGRIWVTSKLGQGSTFYIALPRLPELETNSNTHSMSSVSSGN